MVGFHHYLLLSALLFTIGLFGALTKRNAITVLMSLEVMFNAVMVAAVAVARYIVPANLEKTGATHLLLTGQAFALFVITVAAAEVALGLALVIAIYRHRRTVDITEVAEMKR